MGLARGLGTVSTITKWLHEDTATAPGWTHAGGGSHCGRERSPGPCIGTKSELLALNIYMMTINFSQNFQCLQIQKIQEFNMNKRYNIKLIQLQAAKQ